MSLSNIDYKNNFTLAVAGRIGTVLEAMKMHKVSPSVQEKECQTLRTITTYKDNLVTLGAAGGIGHILQAMKTH